MKSTVAVAVMVVSSAMLLQGCVVRTYRLTRDRIDQDLNAGNRGFVQGQTTAADEQRPTTRTTQMVEVELGAPIRFEKGKDISSSAPAAAPQQENWGNRGYITSNQTPESGAGQVVPVESMEQYTVQKNDTLQKISQKYYGTTKRWHKIFEANADVLKAPNKIYPGQVIKVPVEAGEKAPKGNLK